MNVIPFEFESKSVRVVKREGGEPLFVAKDLAEGLGYVWNGTARIEHVPEEWRGVTSVVTPSGVQEMAVLTEQGMYFFLARSDKPKALPMQKWVAGEVLPSIRRTGAYGIDPMVALNDPATMRGLLLNYSEKVIALESKVADQAPKVAALDRIATGSMGSMCVTDAAKHIQTPPAELFKWLSAHRWIYRRLGSSQWVGYQDKIQSGMIEHKVTTIEPKDEHSKRMVFEQVRITAKGLAKLAVVFSGKPKERKKIGLVGMLHGTAAIVVEQFAKDADFVVWDYDSPQKTLAAMNHCDMVFLYVDHCAHTTQYKLDAINTNSTKVRGGITSMKEAIALYLAE